MSGRSQTGYSGSDWILNAVKQNPEGLLLLAAGAVLIMRRSPVGSGKSMCSDANASLSQTAANSKDGACSMASFGSCVFRGGLLVGLYNKVNNSWNSATFHCLL